MNKEWMTGLGLLGLGLATGGLGLLPAAAGMGLGGAGAAGAGASTAAAGLGGLGGAEAALAGGSAGIDAAAFGAAPEVAGAFGNSLGFSAPSGGVPSLSSPGMFDKMGGLLSEYGKPLSTGLSIANGAKGLLDTPHAPMQSPGLPQYADMSGMARMGGAADLQKLRMARRGMGGGNGFA